MQIPHVSWTPVPIRWNHMVKPSPGWKSFSKNLGASCVPACACCLLHDHFAPWRRGWAHLMSKRIRDTNQLHPKVELFWCIQTLSLKLNLEVGTKSISWIKAMNFLPQGKWTNPQVQAARPGPFLLVLCNWTPSIAYSCLSRCCKRHLILMEQANFLKI